ncbi:hypothetical protein C8Q76DRAFT_183715 [Earliella scabrosa]|nr:hypothetical protein C8Q76DRAFT_183715 [Earliella scabrosa]
MMSMSYTLRGMVSAPPSESNSGTSATQRGRRRTPISPGRLVSSTTPASSSKKLSPSERRRMHAQAQARASGNSLGCSRTPGYGDVQWADDELDEAQAQAARASLRPEHGRRLTSLDASEAETIAFKNRNGDRKPLKNVLPSQEPGWMTNVSPDSSKDGTSKRTAIDIDCLLESPSSSKSHMSTRWKSADLPHGAHHGNLWKGTFLRATLLEYLGRMDDPWTVSDHDFVNILQEIWNEVYGARLEAHEVQVGGCVHHIARQRMYIWRAAFGSSAICAFELYFNATKNEKGEIKYPDVESRARFCHTILRNARVFYKDPEGKSEKGLYRSCFVLGPISMHLNVTDGSISVSSLR